MIPSNYTRRELRALTSLRFFAAAMIVFFHSRGLFGISEQLVASVPRAQAMSFFFVLSGFILVYVYPSLDKVSDIRRFCIARFARLWPVHFAAFLLLVVLLHKDLSWRALPNLAMVNSWFPFTRCYMSYNWVSWAIATEFAFYLLFPLLIYKWEHTWFIKLLVSGFLLVVLIAFCNHWQIPYSSEEAWGLSLHALICVHPLGRLFEFVLGMSFALWRQKKLSNKSIGRSVGTLLELLTVALVIVVIYFRVDLIHAVERHYDWIGPAGVVWLSRSGIVCLFYGLLVVVMALEKGIVSWLLSSRLLVWLGQLSFSIYMVHQILIRYYIKKASFFSFVPDRVALVGFCCTV
ncbi:MAG TPA: acyltransferase, partial [Thermodesulfobacteriota bacterium]|nr:acyltransferase [Thermodesulfobacteriota bacterium]